MSVRSMTSNQIGFHAKRSSVRCQTYGTLAQKILKFSCDLTSKTRFSHPKMLFYRVVNAFRRIFFVDQNIICNLDMFLCNIF